MKIVFASHSYFSPVFVVGSHHLARAAARSKHLVWHLSSALSIAHLPFALIRKEYRQRARICFSGRRIEAGLSEGVPLTLMPWAAVRRAAQPENWYLPPRRLIERWAKRHQFTSPDLLLIDEPRMAALIPALNPRIVIYRPTDIYSVLKDDETIQGVERRLLARADAVVGTSQAVLSHVCDHQPAKPTLLLENGVDLEHFAEARPEPRDIAEIPRPRAIYVGAIDQRFDLALLDTAAKANPGIHFVIIGGFPQQADFASGVPRNLIFLGPKPYTEIPAYLQHADFAVMPLKSNVANDARSPMKLYEFSAAGLPVLSTSTSELRRRALPHVFLADTPQEFAALSAQIAVMGRDRMERSARSCADTNGWPAKWKQLLDFALSVKGHHLAPNHGVPRFDYTSTALKPEL